MPHVSCPVRLTSFARSLATLSTLAALAAASSAAAQTSVTRPLQPFELRFAAANIGVTSLAAVKVPEPPELATYVRDRAALLALGKALFWDQQVGSDGQACASCHFHAGADSRSKNQVNPGFRSTLVPGGDTAFGNGAGGPRPPRAGPNRQLILDDFPLHRLSDPGNRDSAVLWDTNDVVSSQGVFAAAFGAIGDPIDRGTSITAAGPGAVFNVGGVPVPSSRATRRRWSTPSSSIATSGTRAPGPSSTGRTPSAPSIRARSSSRW